MNMKSLRALNTDHEVAVAEAVEHMLDVLARTPRGPLAAIVREHLDTGGKRSRVRLTLQAAEALGVPVGRAVPLAAACELLHNATLVHDDLQDGDTVRRGQPTTWVTHGPAQAINAGDLLLMLPFVALDHPAWTADVRAALSAAVARRAAATVCGQASELAWRLDELPDWGAYVRAVIGKTGALCTLPVEGAALLAGATPEEATELGDALGGLGLLFQVRDDVLDLFGDKGRGQVGNDLREGKISALVLAHLERHPEDERRVLEVLAAPRPETTAADVAEITARFAEGGALRLVAGRMRAELDWLRQAGPLRAEPALREIVLAFAESLYAPVRELADRLSPPIPRSTSRPAIAG